MMFWKIARFEFLYQFRRVPAWLTFGLLALVAGLQVRMNFLADALYDEFYVNSPFVIAVVSVFGTLVWLLAGAPVAGEAAARDVESRMHSLTYTAPVSKSAYLFGRFAAAFLLNAGVLLGIPLGILAAVYLPGTDPHVVGPFRPEGYATAFAYVCLPNAFIATAVQFCFAALLRRAKAAYLASLVFFFSAYGLSIMVGMVLGRADLARLLDPVGMMTIVSDLSSTWTPIEKGTRLLVLEGPILLNRLLWTGVGCLVLLFMHLRFRFTYSNPDGARVRIFRPRKVAGERVSYHDAVPAFSRSFGPSTRVRQTFSIFRVTFFQLAGSRSGLFLLTIIAALAILTVPLRMNNMGVPLEPRTGYLITFLTGPVTNPFTIWVIIPLLIIFYAGEVIWREREAGTDAMTNTAPVPAWAFFLGKFLALSLMMVLWTALLTVAGMLIQARLGLHDPETGLLFKVMFGLQLPDYLLFASLAIVIHVTVNHKAAGHLVALSLYGLIAFGSLIGFEHNLLLFGNGPWWSYSEMRGFGSSIKPWLWFRLYWAAWALLLGLAANLLWVRTRESDLKGRLLLARRRFTRPAMRFGVASLILVFGLGVFIWYNTNVINKYQTAADRMSARAAYERCFSRFAGVIQPELCGTKLEIEIYPKSREAKISGLYRLVNKHPRAIDSIHISTPPGVEMRIVHVGPAASRVLADAALGYQVYRLRRALQPGDSLELRFEVRIRARGFGNRGAGSPVTENGTYIANEEWLPAIGYQSSREIRGASDRRAMGLPARPPVPDLDEADAGRILAAARQIRFEAVVSTDPDQTAVAPGSLRRSWFRNGRSYFHYATDVPMQNQYAVFSARYAVKEGMHRGIRIQILHHPGHKLNLDRMFRSMQASLDYHIRRYGPYPYHQLRLIEEAGKIMGMHAEAMQVTFGEGFSLMNPQGDPNALDLPFAVVAHEVAHQWWGHQLKPAAVAGAPVLAESLAWYSAMGVMEEALGFQQLERLRAMMRQPYLIKPVRSAVPLLQAVNSYQAYRKGPFAFYALSRYIGRHRVDSALRGMLEKHLRGPRLATTRDLYAELRQVTPLAYRSLLQDLFERNTLWELKTDEAVATRLRSGNYKVRIGINVQKFQVDSAGNEKAVPLQDSVEVGIFGSGNKILYLMKHPVHTGRGVFEIIVREKPLEAGIDPNYLLIDEKPADNRRKVKIAERAGA